MNGDRGAAVKQIMKAIEYRTLPTDEIQRRLMELIQKEANRADGPADEELISACVDLMEHFQGREYVEDKARISALNQRLADAIQKKQRSQERRHTAFRTVSAIAAVLVLIVGIGIPLRWTWFERWSTPDEQQHVIMGQEITVDIVASAIAETESKEPIVISNFSEFEKNLDFDPGIPSNLGDEWIAEYGSIRYFSGYVQIVAIYARSNVPDARITCTISYFTDVEYAYFAFEQSRKGKVQSIQGMDIYVSNNIERSSATWYSNNMYVQVVGMVSSEEAVELLLRLIGVFYE